jgi:hypothetical protein
MSEPQHETFTYSGPALIGPHQTPGEIDGTFTEVGRFEGEHGSYRVAIDVRLEGELAGSEPELHTYLIPVEAD